MLLGKVNSTIGNINSSLSGIERAFSFSYDVTGPTGNRRWGYYNMSLPRVNTIPYLAKGAVIPPRSEFLAALVTRNRAITLKHQKHCSERLFERNLVDSRVVEIIVLLLRLIVEQYLTKLLRKQN